ncbi:MAG: cell wall hydrolase, partial [Bdellovibrionales bacterium]|nr:cell wall hydrolase [Bdellovibrionales bacterium]
MKKALLLTTTALLLMMFSYQSYARRTSRSMRCTNPTDAFTCMACNCFNESANEPFRGQVAVGEVVMARVGQPHWPNTICGVIRQPQQFSWFNQMSSRRSVPHGHRCR